MVRAGCAARYRSPEPFVGTLPSFLYEAAVIAEQTWISRDQRKGDTGSGGERATRGRLGWRIGGWDGVELGARPDHPLLYPAGQDRTGQDPTETSHLRSSHTCRKRSSSLLQLLTHQVQLRNLKLAGLFSSQLCAELRWLYHLNTTPRYIAQNVKPRVPDPVIDLSRGASERTPFDLTCHHYLCSEQGFLIHPSLCHRETVPASRSGDGQGLAILQIQGNPVVHRRLRFEVVVPDQTSDRQSRRYEDMQS